MKSIRVLALIVAAGVATPALGWGQAGPPTAPPSQERPLKRELPPEARALLERQREEMRALRLKHREERRALMEKLRQEGKVGGPLGPPEKKAP